MGKLFWKFFIVYWLALMTMGGGMGAAVWLHHTVGLNDEGNSDGNTQIIVKHALPFVSAASLILQKGGVDVLRGFLEELRNTTEPPVFVINESGKDLLNRDITQETMEQARTLVSSNPSAIRRIKTDDGHTYLLFAIFPETPGFKPDNLPPPFEKPPNGKHRHFHPKPTPWLPITLGFIVSLIFSGVSAWYFAKPIRHLRLAFAAVAEGDLNTRAAQMMGERRDELSDLGENFDDMVSKIQVLVDAQQRLLHDVSHELRSPLARIQVAIGLAQQQPDKTPSTMTRIEKESQRMSDLIGELLSLSRLETGFIGSVENIDLSELITEIIEDVQLEADSRSIHIKESIPEQAYYKGHGEALRRAIENVLRNAVKHTKEQSLITVSLSLDKANNKYLIEIGDQGPGLKESELSNIFVPFFRGSNNDPKNNGTGLGLAIAQKAIQAHKGNITAKNKPDGGLLVTIYVPTY